MPKVTVTTAGKSENWEIDVEQTDRPQLTISKGEVELNLSFSADEYRKYYHGVKHCKAYDNEGKEYFLTSLSR